MKCLILDRNPKIADDKMQIKRKWLPENPSAYIIDKYIYSIEASSFHWIKQNNPEIDIDMLPFETITNTKLMKNYDVIFLFNHGLSDAMPFWKNDTNKFVNAWKNLGNRAYPSYELANFVLDKCSYYEYLNKNDIKTADTFCIDLKKPFNIQYKKLRSFLKNKEIEKLFIKPVGGDSGVGTSTHQTPFNTLEKSLAKSKTNGWNKLVVQRFMNFSTHDSPEYKCLYVGGKLQYIVKTFRLGYFDGIIMPNSKWTHLKTLDTLSKKVIKLFEKWANVTIPFGRVDWGYDKNSKEFFLNEFEHAGGTYGEELVHQEKILSPSQWKVDVQLGKAIVKFVSTNYLLDNPFVFRKYIKNASTKNIIRLQTAALKEKKLSLLSIINSNNMNNIKTKKTNNQFINQYKKYFEEFKKKNPTSIGNATKLVSYKLYSLINKKHLLGNTNIIQKIYMTPKKFIEIKKSEISKSSLKDFNNCVQWPHLTMMLYPDYNIGSCHEYSVLKAMVYYKENRNFKVKLIIGKNSMLSHLDINSTKKEPTYTDFIILTLFHAFRTYQVLKYLQKDSKKLKILQNLVYSCVLSCVNDENIANKFVRFLLTRKQLYLL
uniref:ATP-grasp domain-containing protein n=1 Tax=viral metagenome TaxID=1070528 RepID=A0A6C0F837_9ZZZZ|tara:strand:+ start:500 stop:2296 length:1797 start_codon:yes stop_codon:yes gene_type:complete